MEKITYSAKYLKRRKFLTVLPLLAIPFITMAFWALGGGKSISGNDKPPAGNALNIQLPNASLKDEGSFDKLSFYDKAHKDSLAMMDAIKNDPYYKKYMRPDNTETKNLLEADPGESSVRRSAGLNVSANHDNFYEDPNKVKVNRKLEELRKAINTTSKSGSYTTQDKSRYRPSPDTDEFIAQVDKLEAMMKAISSENSADFETERLESMMDKMLDLQHPERVKQKMTALANENKDGLFKVRASTDGNDISLLTAPGNEPKKIGTNRFFGLIGAGGLQTDSGNAISVVVHETQTLTTGGILKLRLLKDAYINSVKIPANNFIYGTVSLNNERLKVTIASIRYNNSLYRVKLSAYDLDGLEGIYIPGVPANELVRESSSNVLQNIGTMSLDPSFGEQAASAGINAAKTIFTKKVKQVKVNVKAGYQLLLKN